uniref:Activating signal cointegrator 1 complex subunit 3 n=1 Tax=Phallusia mammillata TaxID=59560 RepID=A0A6F9DBL7_9ASCI|nr:probable ATP-dependent RNA helicase DHX58 [Phallusia mammillata]
MSSPEEQVALINVIKNELCNKIAPHHCLTIAQSLKNNGKISEEECNKVIQLPRTDKTKSMIEFMLKRKAPGFFLTFLTSLQEAGLSHVRDEIEGKLKPPTELQETHKHMMEIYFPKVITKLKARDVLDNFPDILDEHTKQMVCNVVEGISQNAMFLHYVLKNPNSIEVLLQALRSGQCGSFTFLVDLLEGKEKFSESDSEVNMKVLEKICTHSNRILVKLDPLHLRNHFTLEKSHWDAIKREENRCKRAIMFLNILANSETPWFKRLLLALTACKERDYSELCSKLEEESEDVGSEATHSGDVAMETDVWEVGMETDETVVRGDGINDVNEIPFVNVADRVDHVGEENPQFEGSFLNNFENPPNPPVAPTQQNQRADPGNNVRDNVEKLELRDYQLELAAPALAGENSMIVAPTGSGKTYVALKICAEHIKLEEHKKTIFLVPRVPLVRQQHQLFKRFLGDAPDLLLQVTGETNYRVPINIALKRCKITFMTPQILLNMLREESPELLHEISLLIFDECHHTMKNHPYNDIMRIYLKKKAEGTQQNFPQIVGLTASPGSGKSNSVEQGCKHIFKLLANLDVKIPPVQVKENREELSAFTTNEDFETVSVDRNHRDQFTTRIQHIMQRIEKQIKDKIEQNENVLENFYFNVPDRRGQPVYENEVIAFREKSKLLEEHELSHHFQIYANHLKVYNDALLINEHVRESDAIKYIEENLFQTFHDVEMKLRELYDKSEISKLAQNTPSPLLQKLIESIHQNFSSNPNSRCIIFARTRDIATSLVTCLADSQPLMEFNLNPDYLTGSGAKNSQGGLTKPLQDDKLKRFRDGKSKVMIATSIADEGIDIKECNLVITYNHCSSEIAQVQRKGRGRAKQSKMFILAYSDHHYIERERLNRDRNELTRQTLEYLQTIDRRKILSEIEEIQEKNSKVDVPTTSGQQRTDEIWKLSCSKCRREVTSSDQFCKVKQHYVCVDKEFPSKALKGPLMTIIKSSEEHMSGKLQCGEITCRQEWGSQMIYRNHLIYVLGIKHFVLSNGKETKVAKKWKDAPFQVESSYDDLIGSQGSDVEMDEDVDDDIYEFEF